MSDMLIRIDTEKAIADIEALTDIRIERNRRNGRTQKLHMQYMNMNRQFKVGIGRG